MPEIASLGLKIDSSQVEKGTKELDKLTAAGKKAEQQSAMLGASFKTSGVQAADLLKNTNLSAEARARLTAQLQKQGVATAGVAAADTKLGKAGKETIAGLIGLRAVSGALAETQDRSNNAALQFANTLTRRFVLGYAISQVRGLAGTIGTLIAEMAKVGDLGNLTGIGSSGTQGLLSSAGAKGIDSATMSTALIAFNQQIPLAKSGVGSLGELLQGNKIAVTDTNDALFKFSDLVRNAANDTARQSMLVQAGLPPTMEMVRFWKQGSEEIKAQIGIIAKLSDSQVDAAQKTRDAWYSTWQNIKDGAAGALGYIILRNQEITKQQNARKLTKDPSNFGLRFDVSTASLDTVNSDLQSALEKRAQLLRSDGGSVDTATEKAREQDRISRMQQYLGLLGQTTTAEEARLAVQLQADAAGVNKIGIDTARLETLKRLAEEQVLGIAAIKSSTDAQRVEAETIGMSTGQAAAYTAAQNALNEAKRNGRMLTAENIDAIQREAAALGDATTRTDNLKWSYENIVRGPMQTFRSEIVRGAKALDALKAAGVSAADTLSRKFADLASQQLWKAFFPQGAGGGGLFGLFSGLFGGGNGGAAVFNMGGSAGAVYAKGGIPPGPGINAYSNKIVTEPTVFAFAKGAGLMGEAGDEAVVPLIRTPDGNLGVRSQSAPASATPVQVTLQQYNTFTNADPGSEARMREWSKQTKDMAVQEAVAQVARVHSNKPNFLASK